MNCVLFHLKSSSFHLSYYKSPPEWMPCIQHGPPLTHSLLIHLPTHCHRVPTRPALWALVLNSEQDRQGTHHHGAESRRTSTTDRQVDIYSGLRKARIWRTQQGEGQEVEVGVSSHQALREDLFEERTFEQKCDWSEGMNGTICSEGRGNSTCKGPGC